MKISYYSSFRRAYKKLPTDIKTKLALKEDIFRHTPFHPSLRTHKLSGGMSGYYSFSVDYTYRVAFEFIEKDEVLFIDVGTHDIYE
jgi:mRNA-degrading endonuclease YafQ of YafQ-DinJ toxin-antitoxin module